MSEIRMEWQKSPEDGNFYAIMRVVTDAEIAKEQSRQIVFCDFCPHLDEMQDMNATIPICGASKELFGVSIDNAEWHRKRNAPVEQCPLLNGTAKNTRCRTCKQEIRYTPRTGTIKEYLETEAEAV